MNHSDPMVGVQKSHLNFFATWYNLTELNKVLMLACEMSQFEGGIIVEGWISVGPLGG